MGSVRSPSTGTDIKQQLTGLCLPLIAAPMFLVSGPDMVTACCRHGVVGSFPALNQRSSSGYAQWLDEIGQQLEAGPAQGIGRVAPFAVNLIVHASNPRLAPDLEITVRHRVPIVITSLGAVRDVVEAVHSYGGIVLHDVTNARHAAKALDAGVDGLIAVSAGAGGHAGSINPFALVAELRALTDRIIVLAGGLSHGGDIAAAVAAGADYAYMGTRLIATRESLACDAYKSMLVTSTSADIIYTPRISGIHANFLKPSIADNGLDLADLSHDGPVNVADELNHKNLAWKHIWSAGHGTGAVRDVPTTAELLTRLRAEYDSALSRLHLRSRNILSA